MIVFEKFGQHQPLNRQSERYALEGVPIALSTMADAVGSVFLQSRRLKAAGRKKKSRGAAATTERAGHQASNPRSLRTGSTQAMPAL
jgi:transposase